MIAAAPARSHGTEILLEAREALSRRLFAISRNLRLEFREGFLLLYGQVSTYYQKQIAQEAVRRLEAVEQVVNHIEVASA